MIGMDARSGAFSDDLAHLRQSIADVLTTPIGSRVQRREYGSLLPELIDQPFNDETRLRLFGATATALMRWEPRISLTAINFESAFDGGMVVEITGSRTDTAQDFSLTVPVS